MAKRKSRKYAPEQPASGQADGSPVNSAVQPIEYRELLRRLADPDVPKEDLLPYLETRFHEHAHERRPIRVGLAPALFPNELVTYEEPESVNARARGNWVLGTLNSAYRQRRLTTFNRRVAARDPRPIIMAEGDSWFQYPLVLDDTIDHLSDSYTIFCMSGAGDELRGMAGAMEFVDLWKNLRNIRKLKVRALLLSAGGNDIVGAQFAGILRPFAKGQSARDSLDAAAWKRKLEELRDGYRRVLKAFRTLDASVPILFHAYDYANPLPAQGPGWPRDGWLGAPMRGRGYADGPLQAEIVKELLEDVNIAFKQLADEEPGVHFVDNRTVVKGRWFDELHPTDDGFRDVAANFRKSLHELGIR